jgi:hypothetical protein
MKTRTMYMHTLDDRPASYDDSRGPYIHFVGGRNRAKLVPTLVQLRREQRATIRERIKAGRNESFRYGYVLVEVPA